jgi:sigma-B regulation protein RsbU (phosphoserine phosphatase)
MQSEPAKALDVLRSSIFINVIIFLIFGSLITMLVSRNLTLPFGEIIQTLRGVRNGQFDKKVRVTTNDEIGYTGDVINEMTEGLIERERMQQSLNLAREVQQNLLPKSNLKVNGFDIAGKSVYCDETGGDYYDFISIEDADKQKIGVAIGDVSGHGISSALLMATVRSSLRQRASLPGSTAKIITDVNRQLVQDVEDSGQFMTMFFLALNTATRQLEWVRAGHDPAIIYDPGSDSFSELGGSGIALGVDGGWSYEDNKKTDFSNGQIIFLSTDGIWEARNKKGEMLGKKPILNLIRQNASSDATQIIDAIFDILDKFIGEVKIEDDITSVIIKMQN